jgi:SCP-2 sterol transfer family
MAHDATLNATELAQLVKTNPPDELRRIMQSDRRSIVLDSVFAGMPDAFQPEKARGVDATVHWRVADRPDGDVDTYELVIANGTCEVSPRPDREPRLALTIGVVDFMRMVTGNASPVMLFMRGKMKARGDLGLATKFPSMFDPPKG